MPAWLSDVLVEGLICVLEMQNIHAAPWVVPLILADSRIVVRTCVDGNHLL